VAQGADKAPPQLAWCTAKYQEAQQQQKYDRKRIARCHLQTQATYARTRRT
jgi:hypothetical protein